MRAIFRNAWARHGLMSLLGAAALASWAGDARAQAARPFPEEPADDERRDFLFDFGVFGGGHFYSADHGLGRNQGDPPGSSPKHGGVFGGRLGIAFSRWVSAEFEASLAPTRTRSEVSAMSIVAYRGSFLLRAPNPYQFRPFLILGYGALVSFVEDDMPALGSVPEADQDGFLHGGLGFQAGSDRFGLRVEGRVLAPGSIFSKVLKIGDETGFGGPDWEVLGGLYFNFGERGWFRKEVVMVQAAPAPQNPDPDGDGIAGKTDRCPNVAEDKDGFKDEDGCPENDNDGDGIPDPLDKCPMHPESKNGVDDEDGCPEDDLDNDGLMGSADRCPNATEDKDGFQDEDGCPDLDNDSDGVADARDKCPDQPESKNNYQDDDGCPDEVPAEVKKFTGVIEGINFKTNSADILPGSYALLDRAVKVLQDFPDVNLEISGHTDNRGPDDYNRSLSQRRADAVKDYFIARGIDIKRLASIGFGEERPIADNGSGEGRAKNRRTEFRLVNPGEK